MSSLGTVVTTRWKQAVHWTCCWPVWIHTKPIPAMLPSRSCDISSSCLSSWKKRCDQNKHVVDKESSLHTLVREVLRVSESKLSDAGLFASSFLRHSGGWKKVLKPNLWELCIAVPLVGCIFLPSSAELFLIKILERSWIGSVFFYQVNLPVYWQVAIVMDSYRLRQGLSQELSRMGSQLSQPLTTTVSIYTCALFLASSIQFPNVQEQ